MCPDESGTEETFKSESDTNAHQLIKGFKRRFVLSVAVLKLCFRADATQISDYTHFTSVP